MTHPVYPCLWFDGKAKEAAEYYCSIFTDSKILSQNPMVIMLSLNGSTFMLLNGGPMYTFTPATSFVINCDTQEEIDMYWDRLGARGKYSKCGWLDDKFGVSWQIVPTILGKLMSGPKAPKVIEAFMQMTKFDIAALEKAAE